MKDQPHRLKWHMLFFITLFAMIAGIYSASQTINYSWQWQRVLPYIVDTTPIDILAQDDGSVEVKKDGTVIVNFDNSDKPEIIKGAEEILVYDGDIVFQGDLLARKNDVRTGVLVKGLLMTLQISVISLFFAILIGLVAALMRISSNPFNRNFSLLYV